MKRKLAYWKTYVGRPEEDWARRLAMNQLGRGLYLAGHDEDALSVQEAELSMLRRLRGSEDTIIQDSLLAVQTNLACSYRMLGRNDQALSMWRDVYSGRLKLDGEEHEKTLIAANNYATSLKDLSRFEEAKALMRKTMPIAQRFLGESNVLTLRMRMLYARSLYEDASATPDDLRQSVTTLEATERTARRVLGGAHPITRGIELSLRESRAELSTRETPSPPPGGA